MIYVLLYYERKKAWSKLLARWIFDISVGVLERFMNWSAVTGWVVLGLLIMYLGMYAPYQSLGTGTKAIDRSYKVTI